MSLSNLDVMSASTSLQSITCKMVSLRGASAANKTVISSLTTSVRYKWRSGEAEQPSIEEIASVCKLRLNIEHANESHTLMTFAYVCMHCVRTCPLGAMFHMLPLAALTTVVR